MNIREQIDNYIASQPELKRNDLLALHRLILGIDPKTKLRFLDGKNSEGKIVSNPSIGYGSGQMKYADGSVKEFYQVGISSNTTGISVYIMSIKDRTYLAQTYGKTIGKASVSGYCFKFKALKDIDVEVLKTIIRDGLKT